MSTDYPELVTRSRRAAGLSDRIDNDALIERLAAMVRSTPTRPPARLQGQRDPEEGTRASSRRTA